MLLLASKRPAVMGYLCDPPANNGTFLLLTITIYRPLDVITIWPCSLNVNIPVLEGQSILVRVSISLSFPGGLISNTLMNPSLDTPNKYLSLFATNLQKFVVFSIITNCLIDFMSVTSNILMAWLSAVYNRVYDFYSAMAVIPGKGFGFISIENYLLREWM